MLKIESTVRKKFFNKFEKIFFFPFQKRGTNEIKNMDIKIHNYVKKEKDLSFQ
jgi:hypothetical protein